MHNRTSRILGGSLAAALLLSACSGGLSKEEFISQADKICASAEERFNELDQPTTPAELEGFVEEAEGIMDELLGDLRDLEAPDDISEQVDEMLTNLEAAVDQFPDLVDAAADQDLETVQTVTTEIQEKTDAANEAAQDIGLDQCGDTSATG